MTTKLFTKSAKMALVLATALVAVTLPSLTEHVSASAPVIVGGDYTTTLVENPKLGHDSGGFLGGWNGDADLNNGGRHGRYIIKSIRDINNEHPWMKYTNVGVSPSGRSLDLKIIIQGADGDGDKNGNALLGFGQDSIYVTSYGVKSLRQEWVLLYSGTEDRATDVKGMMYGMSGIDFGQSLNIHQQWLHKDNVFETRNGNNGYNTGRYRNGQTSRAVKAFIDNSGSKTMYAPAGQGQALYYADPSTSTGEYTSPLLGDGYDNGYYTIQGSASNVTGSMYPRTIANLFINVMNGSFWFRFNADGTRAGQGNSTMLENSPVGIHQNVILRDPYSVQNTFGFKYAGENFTYNRPTIRIQAPIEMSSDLKMTSQPMTTDTTKRYVADTNLDATGTISGSRNDGIYVNAPWSVDGNQYIGSTRDHDGQTVHIKRYVELPDGNTYYMVDLNGQDVFIDTRGFNNVSGDNGTTDGTQIKRKTDASANDHWYSISSTVSPVKSVGSEPFDDLIMHQTDRSLQAGASNVDGVKMFSVDNATGKISDETDNFKVVWGQDAVGQNINLQNPFNVPAGQTGEIIATFKHYADTQTTLNKTYYMQVEHSWRSGGNLNGSGDNWSDTQGNNHTGLVLGDGRYADPVYADSSWHSTVSNNSGFQRALNGRYVYLEQDAQTPSISGSLVDSDNPAGNGVKEVTRDMNNVGGNYGYRYQTTTPFATKNNTITSKVSDYFTGAVSQYGINDAQPNFQKNGKDTAMLSGSNVRVYLADNQTSVNPDDQLVGQGRTIKWGDNVTLYQTGSTATGLTADDKPSLDRALNARNRLIGNSFVMVGNGYGNTGSNLSVNDLKVRVPNTLVVSTKNYVSNKSLANGGTTADFQPTLRRTTDDTANNSWYSITQHNMPNADGSHVNTIDLSTGALSNRDDTKITSVKVFKQSGNGAPQDVTGRFAIDASNSTNVSIKASNVNSSDITGQVYYVEIGQTWNAGRNLASFRGNWNDANNQNRVGIKQGAGDYMLADWSRAVLDTGSPATSYNMGYTGITSGLAYLEQVAEKQSLSGVLTDSDNPQANGVKQVVRGMNNINGNYGYRYAVKVPFVTNNDMTTNKLSDYYAGMATKYGINDGKPNYQVSGNDTPLLNAKNTTLYTSDNQTQVNANSASGIGSNLPWGGSLSVYQSAGTASVTRSSADSAQKALDARQGIVGNTATLAGDGFGNTNSNLTVNDLTVKVPKMDSVIHHYKDGTTSKSVNFQSPIIVTNPNPVADTKANGWGGLPVTANPETLTGWDYVTASYVGNNSNPLYGQDSVWFSYKKHVLDSSAKKVSIFTAQKANNSQNVSGSNPANGRWQNTVALTIRGMWNGYKISTDSDLKDPANLQRVSLSGTDNSTYSMLYGQTPVAENVTQNNDGTVDVTAYYVKKDGTYRVSDDKTNAHFAGDSFASQRSDKTPWLAFNNTKSDYMAGKVNVATNQVVGAEALTQSVDPRGIERGGQVSAPAVVVATSGGQTKTYNETYKIDDDASRFSLQAGYGFSNKVNMTVSTYNLWNTDKDTSKDDSSYDSNSVTTSATFTPEMLTQSDNKQTEQNNVYSKPTITRSVKAGDTDYLGNTVNADQVTYQISFQTNPSYVRKGAGALASQSFVDKSQDSDYRQVDKNQILIPSTTSVFTQLRMTANYGKNLPDNKALFFNNPRFVLGKTIRVSAPRYVATNDKSLTQAQTPIAIETPNYGESTGDKAIDDFLNK